MLHAAPPDSLGGAPRPRAGLFFPGYILFSVTHAPLRRESRGAVGDEPSCGEYQYTAYLDLILIFRRLRLRRLILFFFHCK